MRRTGITSFALSLGAHAVLLGVVVLCAVKVTVTPPKIHLVYGEVGSESSTGEIWTPGAENPPQTQVEEPAQAVSMEAMDAQLMGTASSALGDGARQVTTPLLMTADGAGAPIFGVESSATPKLRFSPPSFPSSDPSSASSGRAGTASGTDVASIPQPIYPKESRQRGEQGTVLLEVQINSDGSIGEIKVLEHPGHERLVNAAIEAIKKARIEPAVEDGRRIASTVRVPFNFVLR